jgi:hypothetical protein
VVLLVLAVVWLVLLVSWFRSRTDGSFSDSVSSFRRHLTVLERATPGTVRPANRLRSGPVAGRQPMRPGPALRTGYASRSMVGAAGFRRLSPAALRRRQAQRRRRDVFFALLAGVIGTFVVALIPGLKIMWPVQLAFDALFLVYLALLVRMRNLAAERAVKLTFIPPPRRAGRPQPAYDLSRDYGELSLRRAAN